MSIHISHNHIKNPYEMDKCRTGLAALTKHGKSPTHLNMKSKNAFSEFI